MPKAAIIIPAYNVERYVHRAIESCINQTASDIEIIIIDDGSTDGTASVIKKYAEQDSRIVFRTKQNEGVSAARNDAIDLATADYLLFLDADDWLEHNAVERLLAHVQSDRLLLVCAERNHVHQEKDGTLKVEYEGDHTGPYILNRTEVLHLVGKSSRYKLTSSCYRLYEHRIIKENNLYFDRNIHYAEDGLFVFEYLNLVDGIYYFSEPLWNVLDRPGSATKLGYSPRWLSGIHAVDRMLEKKGLDRQTVENLLSLKSDQAKLVQMVGIRTAGTPIEDIKYARSILRKNIYYHLKGCRRIKWLLEAIALTVFPIWVLRILLKK